MQTSQHITKTATTKRNILSRNGGEWETQKDHKSFGHRSKLNNRQRYTQQRFDTLSSEG